MQKNNGYKKKLDKVLDFSCGSGSLLLNVRKKLGTHGIGKIYGQEKNITTYNLARMNMLLHGVKDSEFEIHHGDSLSNDWDILKEANPAKKLQFDAVVANPPFSYRWEPTDTLAEDFRFKSYGLAPKSAADFAFLLHGFHFLGKEGVMAIILPHGVLFRGGIEDKIRRKLLADGNIDTIIGLPANLFFSTGIPVCIIVLKKCKKPNDVLFINASDYFEKGKRQNKLLPEHIEKIVSTYQFRKEEEHYSRCVSMKVIESNEYNLKNSEFSRLLNKIVSADVYTSARLLREKNTLEREDGTPLHYTLVNIKDWCKNTFEVINQLRVNTHSSYQHYDVILLINGVPVVQIELKNLEIHPRKAMQQIVDYKKEPGNGYTNTLLCFMQLFIVSNRSNTWYFANNNSMHFSFEADERFLPIYQLCG